VSALAWPAWRAARTIDRVKPIAISIAVHIALIALALPRPASAIIDQAPGMPDSRGSADPLRVIDVTMIDTPRPQARAHGGGRSGGAGRHLATTSHRAWDDMVISSDGAGAGAGVGDGGRGIGIGLGDGGRGRGIGLGDGGSIGDAPRDLPAPPRPAVSRARPARLLSPSRQAEVDDSELFGARITVDASGDVVAAYMTRVHPGSREDTAESAIWRFRYDPARDFDGNPVRSTFEQTFAVR
jgi:hypothetical protein